MIMCTCGMVTGSFAFAQDDIRYRYGLLVISYRSVVVAQMHKLAIMRGQDNRIITEKKYGKIRNDDRSCRRGR